MKTLSLREPEAVWVPFYQRHMTHQQLKRVNAAREQQSTEWHIKHLTSEIKDTLPRRIAVHVLLFLWMVLTLGAHLSLFCMYFWGAQGEEHRFLLAAMGVLVVQFVAAKFDETLIYAYNFGVDLFCSSAAALYFAFVCECFVLLLYLPARIGRVQDILLLEWFQIGTARFLLVLAASLVLVIDGLTTLSALGECWNSCSLLRKAKERLSLRKNCLALVPGLRGQVEEAKLWPDPEPDQKPKPEPKPAPVPALPPEPQGPMPLWPILEPRPGLPPADVPLAAYKEKQEPEPTSGPLRVDIRDLLEKLPPSSDSPTEA